MKIDTMKLLFGTTVGPLWAAADEGGSGGTGGDKTTTEGADKTTEGGAKPPAGEVVLGGDQPGDKPDEGAATGDDAKKDGEKSNEDKAKEAAEAALDVVPEDGKYEFELPEGIELPEDKQQFWSKEFKDAGLTKRQAARMIELQAGIVLAEQDNQNKQLADQQAKHLKDAKADKDIGGQRWDETVKMANIGLKAFGGSTIKDLILVTGNGNNPEMLRELRRIGERFKSDTFESGSTSKAPEPTEKKWYGETTPETKKG